jgi:isopenicillin N synthase-like dioxygenase
MYVKTVDFTSKTAPQEFVETLRETGFAVVSNHPISQELVENVYRDWAGFFKCDSKFDYLFDPTVVRQTGYIPGENAKGNPITDIKEFYNYREVKDLPKGMSHDTQTLLESMTALGEHVLKWIEEALPESIARDLSCPLYQMVKGSDLTHVRILHYPPFSGTEKAGAYRAAEHQDINVLSILPAATAPGLQVLDNAGNWHEVSCDYGTLIFNAGDSLQLATKGFYKSTTHRVTNPVGEEALRPRYSLPLFLHARKEVQLSETLTTEQYLDQRLHEVGLKPTKKAA